MHGGLNAGKTSDERLRVSTTRLTIGLLGIAIAGWGLWTPTLRDAEGDLLPLSCLVVGLALAIILLACFFQTSLFKAAGWFALFLLAQALYLQLIDAGPWVHYEHLRPAGGVTNGGDAWLLAAIGAQTLAVMFAFWSHAGRICDWLRKNLGIKCILIVSIVYFGLGAHPSRDIGSFGIELALTGIFRLVQLGCLSLAIISIPADTRRRMVVEVYRFLDGATHTARRIDLLVYICSAWVLLATVVLAIFSYERHPHVPDEVAYLFHARYFAEGKLSVPAPPVPEAFKTYLYDCDNERCISPVPPGWPAILAIGVKFGAPWLVNPVLAAIGIFLSFLVVRELHDARTARLSVLLLSASPWYLFVGMSLMTHMLSFVYALIATYAVLRLRHSGRVVWASAGGIAVGLVSITRPLEGLIVAIVLGLAALWVPGKSFRFGPVLVLGFSAALVGAIILPYNHALTGNPFVFPIMDYADRVLGPGVNALGFGPDKGIYWGGLDPFPGHGLADVLVNTYLNINAIQVELFGWSVGSLLPALIFLFLGSLERVDYWVLLWILAVVGLHSLYWFSGGPDFAARYWFLTILPFIVLTARGILRLESIANGDIGNGKAAVSSAGAVYLGTLLLCLSALSTFVPWRAIDKYHEYRGMRPDIRELIEELDLAGGLVIIRGESHPDLASAFVYGDLDPYGDGPVFALDRGPELLQRLKDSYPDRPFWILEGPSQTGREFRVVQRPYRSEPEKVGPNFQDR